MALSVVSVRPTGAGSCGIHHRASSFRSGMAPLYAGALTLQSSAIGLTCRVVAPSRRTMVAVSCHGAAGLYGSDSPLDPKASLPQQLKSVAERTLSMVRELRTPEKGADKLSVGVELGELRAECESLVEDLAAGYRSSDSAAASITLLGIHAGVDVLLELFSGRHASLEASTMHRLLNSMAQTQFLLQEQGIRGPAAAAAGEEVLQTTSLPDLLKTLAKKTIILLAEVSEFHLSKADVTVPERMTVSPELNALRDMCGQLIEEGVAVGALLGLHARLRIVFLFCVRAADDHLARPDCLDARISAGLATSFTDTEQRVRHYLETDGDAGR